MDERSGKRIYDTQVVLCKVFGGDVRRRCLEKGVPEEMIEKFLHAAAHLDRFFDRHDWNGDTRQGI